MDIVERLRAFDSIPDANVIILVNEAADEIDRLREVLREIVSVEKDSMYGYFDMTVKCIETARAALKGDE